MQVPLGREMTSFSFIGSQTLKNGSKPRLWRRENTLGADKADFWWQEDDWGVSQTHWSGAREWTKSMNPRRPKSTDENSEDKCTTLLQLRMKWKVTRMETLNVDLGFVSGMRGEVECVGGSAHESPGVRGNADWNCPPSSGTTVTVCVRYFMTGRSW